MKILAFTDIESRKKYIEIIKRKIKKDNPEVLVFAGDLSYFGLDLDVMVKLLVSLKKPVVLVHGNHEEEDELKILCSKHDNLHFIHKKSFVYGDYVFLGFGGLGFSERTKELEDFMLKKNLKGRKPILVVHQPPYGSDFDKMPFYGHVGNKSVNYVIRHLKPVVAMFGHLHEHFGKKGKLYDTLLVNPGQEGMIINV